MATISTRFGTLHGARRSWAPALLLAPAGIILVVAVLVPIGLMIVVSLTDYDQRSLFTGSSDLVGIDQYLRILGDPDFWAAFARTIAFTAAMVIGSVAIGMAVSHLLTRVGPAIRYITTIVLILAWATPNVASSVVWTWLFQPGYGVVNWMLTQVGVFGDMTNTDWANDPVLGFIAIWTLVVWQAVPFIALTLYAAETQVPEDYREAARLDGAGELRVYLRVTLPLVAPTLLLITLLSVIWDFNVFNQIWLLTGGGPDGATSTLGVFSYITAFVRWDIGGGSAIAVITTALLGLLSALYIRRLLKSGERL